MRIDITETFRKYLKIRLHTIILLSIEHRHDDWLSSIYLESMRIKVTPNRWYSTKLEGPQVFDDIRELSYHPECPSPKVFYLREK